MVKPSGSYAHVTFRRYPCLPLIISPVQCIDGWRAGTGTEAGCIQQVPVGFTRNSIFITYPADLRPYIAKDYCMRRYGFHCFPETIPIVYLFFPVWTFPIGAIPP